MSSIDERIVSMAFENAKFEAGISQTLASIQKLNDSLAKVGAVNGLQNIEASANKVTLEAPMSALDKLKAKLGIGLDSKGITDIEKAGQGVTLLGPQSALDKLRQKLGMGIDSKPITDLERASNQVTLEGAGKAIDGISLKLGAMQTAAMVAFGTLVSQATTAAAGLTKSLSLGPITQGLDEYSTNMKSIQTILANTKASGADLQDVNRALRELNKYSDQTIYNFSEMAKNIGTFTAAGVDLETATGSIKGIANIAALSGSSSQQAATAMYQLSQAIASGRVSLQDWNSVVNAGMGGSIFQRALAETAVAMGKIDKNALSLDGKMKNVKINGESFRESIMAKPGEQSWLSSEVLTNTLNQFTGDLSEAELAAQGFSKAQIQAIQDQAKMAKAAATEVKTLSGVMDVVKESIGSGWAATFQLIFGDFEEAKKLFTGVTSYITSWTNKVADARNEMLGDWKKLGGRDDLLAGLKAGFDALLGVLKPIRDAFRDVFPATTGKQLAEMTKNFREFMEGLKPSEATVDGLRRTFAGLFAVMHIGWEIVKQLAGRIFDLLGIVGNGSGGFLNFTGGIGDFLVAVDKAITKGGALTGIFDALDAVLQAPLRILMAISEAFFGLFDGVDEDKAEGVAGSLKTLGDSLEPLSGAVDLVTEAWQKFVDVIEKIKSTVGPWITDIVDQFKSISGAIVEAFTNMDFDAVFAALNTTLIGGIFLAIKKAIGGGIGVDFGGGVLEKLGSALGVMTKQLTLMQKNVQASILLKIAGAIGILAAGIFVLSTIDPKRLGTAMTAVAVGMGQLVGAMALLSKAAGGTAFLTMPFIAASMVGLATALTILAAAMKIFATMSWEELAKGLAGVGGALTAIGVGLKFMGPASLIQGPALIALALGLNVLAVAVKQFSNLSWADLGKGLLGVGGALLMLGVGLGAVGPSMLLVGPGLIAAAFGMNLLAGAVRAFGSMNLLQLATGVLGAAAALGAMGVAISLIPPTVALQAAGLVILGVALTGIAGAVAAFGSMPIGKLAKGIIAMGGALVILGIGLTAMAGALPGSVALIAAAGAFAILAPALGFLGSLEWGTIFKGLAAIALTLGTLAIVGAVAAVPLIALGGALAVLGLGLTAVTVPIYILAKALSLLGAEGTKGVGVMVAALTAFIAILPKIIIDFVKGLVEIIAAVADLAPKVVGAVGKILDSVLQIVIDAAPKLATAIGVLLGEFVRIIDENSVPIIDAGFRLLTGFLSGIGNNIALVVRQAVDIVTKFLASLKGDAPKITESGVATLSAFLLGIGNHFPKLVETVAKMINKFIESVTTHIPRIIAKGTELIVKFLVGIASKIGDVIAAGVHLISKFLEGIGNAIPRIIAKALDVAEKFVRGVAKGTAKLVDIGFQAVVDFLNGTANAIRNRGPELRRAGWNVADALIDGIYAGIQELGQKVLDALGDLVKLMPKKVRQLLGIESPSKVFAEIGRYTMAGMAVGIDKGSEGVDSSMASAAKSAVDTAKDAFGRISLDGLMETDPVITPVLDLTAVEKEARKLGDLTNITPITAAASYGQASAISEEQQAAQTAEAAQAAQESKTFNFEQNNYSPEALSDVEIYRQTNNQLSQLRSALGLAS